MTKTPGEEVPLGDLVAAVFDDLGRYGTDPSVRSHLATQMIMLLLRSSASGQPDAGFMVDLSTERDP